MTAEKILSFLYSGLYIMLCSAMVLLAVLAAGEKVPEEAREPPLLRPFQKMAVFVYRRFGEYRDSRRKKGRELHIPGEEGVRADLTVLYPSLKAKRQEALYRIGQIEKILLLFAGGVLLAGLMHVGAIRSVSLLEDGSILRAPAGGDDQRLSLKASPAKMPDGADAGEASEAGYGTYAVTVHARKLTRQEAEKLAEEILQGFPEQLLGENADTSRIRSPLALPSAEDVRPFTISWESSRYAVMDDDGSVYNSDYVQGQAEEVELTAALSYEDYRFEKKMAFTVLAPVRDEEELLRDEIGGALKKAEEESSTRESFTLPDRAAGLSILWTQEPEDASAGILVLLAAACALAWYVMDYRLHEQTKARSRQLAVDYPQFISRMVLYMGAGMSVRNVFYKCAAEYTAKMGRGKRYLYEEVLLVCNELDSGVPESEAYMHFGHRCRSRQYTKLCSLLVQNLRRGNDALLSILREEARSSFEERKNLARELGEEAGTKLLFPMMIMLGITMLIIIVPAYFGFSM